MAVPTSTTAKQKNINPGHTEGSLLSIFHFPVVYLIKTTTTTRKMEDPEQKLFRMTPVLCNNKKQTAIRLGFPITTFGNDDMDGTARERCTPLLRQ